MERTIMKFWVKILVAVCVILVAVFAVWAFFFRDKEEVQAYNKTAELIDYKQSLGIRDKIIQLQSMDYINGNKEKVIGDDTEAKKNILKYRKFCFDTEEITGYGNLVFCSYFLMDEHMDDIFEYYLPFTKTDSVKSSSLKRLKGDIDDYIDSLKVMNSNLDELIKYQNVITGMDAEYGYLAEHYEKLYNQYRSTLNDASKLMLSIVNFIDISVYSDNLIMDTTFALNDAFARTLITATNVDERLAADYAHHVYVVIKAIDNYNGESDIFTSYSEYEFLTSYSNLYNNYQDSLNDAYSQNLETKQKMAVADKNALSIILQKAQNAVTIVLKTIGY